MPENEPAQLRRTLGFWALLAYGVGDMLGAGIYALVGKVGGIAGTWAWVSFAVAMLAAGLTAAVYAELATRFPRSGGAAHYCGQAFRRPGISIVVGWMVLCSGLVSMATSSRAFAGYLKELAPAVPNSAAIFAFLLVVGIITYRGIRESSTANIICTTIELSGLLLVVTTGLIFIFGNGAATVETNVSPPVTVSTITWIMVLQGAGLAFYACIGFEDMANVAEEVKTPERTLPAALLLAIGIVAVCYMLVAYVATSAVSPEILSKSEAPLTTVIQTTAPWAPVKLFSGIAMFAVANTSLLNCVMGSRLLHGMARERLLPAWLGHVHPTRQTPYRASLLIVVVALVLAVTGTVGLLANTTSLLLLTVFIIAGIALLVVQKRDKSAHQGFRVPWPVPVASIVVCAVLIVFSQQASMGMALALTGVGVLIAFIRGRANLGVR